MIYRTDSLDWSTQLPENVSVSDGKSILAVKNQDSVGQHYTEAGWHTSVWMMKHFRTGGAGPAVLVQELDVCQNDSPYQDRHSLNLHRWKPEPHLQMGWKKVNTTILPVDFPAWSCEFTRKSLNCFCEGKLVQRVVITNFVPSEGQICLTTIASYLGHTEAVDDNKLPAAAEFDYVRLYQTQ